MTSLSPNGYATLKNSALCWWGHYAFEIVCYATLRADRITVAPLKHGLDKAHINLMISRSGREKPTQTQSQHEGRAWFLFFCLLCCHTFFAYEATVPRTTSSQRENIFDLKRIFLSCIYLWAWEHRSIKEINNGEQREVSGTGDMKLMRLILDYLYYFLALCTLGIPMSTVCAKREKLQTREAGSSILSPSLDLSVSGCVEILEEECYSFMFC